MELCHVCKGRGRTFYRIEGLTGSIHFVDCLCCAGSGTEPKPVIVGQTANYNFIMTPEYIERDR